jgi:tetratricopeptide (TPR) repeat protein
MSYQEESQIRLKRLHTKQAITYAMEGKWQDAVAANKEIVKESPDDVDAYNRLGRAYLELSEYSRARDAYKTALEIDPYNTIAEKNLRRLTRLEETKAGTKAEAEKFEPKIFIEETGKAGVVKLQRLAPPEVLAKVVAGDVVHLKVEGTSLIAETRQEEYLGQVEAKDGLRLVKLIEGGNKYTASIVSSTENSVTVIIREVYRDPGQSGTLSFPTRGVEEAKVYSGDRLVKREPLEYEEEMGEEGEYAPQSEEGETLLDGFHEIDEKVE